jgi:hypothetical protein
MFELTRPVGAPTRPSRAPSKCRTPAHATRLEDCPDTAVDAPVPVDSGPHLLLARHDDGRPTGRRRCHRSVRHEIHARRDAPLLGDRSRCSWRSLARPRLVGRTPNCRSTHACRDASPTERRPSAFGSAALPAISDAAAAGSSGRFPETSCKHLDARTTGSPTRTGLRHSGGWTPPAGCRPGWSWMPSVEDCSSRICCRSG